MRRFRPVLALLLAAGPAAAAPLSTDDSGCGGDAYSSAEVVEGRRPRGRPLTAMPDTLCADLAAPPARTRIEIYGVPGLGGAGPGGYDPGGGYDAGRPGPDGLGGTGAGAPYERGPPRRPRRGD
ncbi:hypothetical protein ASF27_01295 [Methylobacterium sp. Leaf102]|uniref:hypothetical protein n=1 Tax=unclassified Methylobacterium TaxID=2615210 RepID=UPI0006FA9591|nr:MULTISPECIES: hypothetical protein [unclassified Methylobacterium]KQO69694.1 hypothetical protein ASF22_03660 [Methylobacterium sp. Leaf87]KQP34230.1 hypothetical protein ASF27_01295 [Methylobacterium sp. Leaf102]USU33347.1 hypothetical protein NG677_06690 [Methylobacterium sp. OTU13CASTA1]